MPVTRAQILSRGLRNCCPNCGHKTLFQPKRLLTPNRVCPNCGMEFERGEGFYLGGMTINYSVAVFGAVLPLVLLGTGGVIPLRPAVALAAVCGIGLPFALYRPTRSWWLMCYFYFLPQQLPANQPPEPDAEDDDNA